MINVSGALVRRAKEAGHRHRRDLVLQVIRADTDLLKKQTNFGIDGDGHDMMTKQTQKWGTP
jgi:hypothetical protein